MLVWVVSDVNGVPLMVFPDRELAASWVNNNSGNADCNFGGIHIATFSTI